MLYLSHYRDRLPGCKVYFKRDPPKQMQTQCYHLCVNRAGYVLAGGRSSRMGRDKALLPYHGEVLVQHIAKAVAAAAGSAVLVGDPAVYGSLGYPVIPDLYPGEGPLGGIITALSHTNADWNLVTACDMPALSSDFLGVILAAAEQLGEKAVVPVGPGGKPEPLCGVYHRGALATLDRVFARGGRKIMAALDSLPAALLPVSGSDAFQNLNTPEDLAVYGGK